MTEHAADPGRAPDERIGAALASLDGIEAMPLSEHAERYGEVHERLQAALADIDGETPG